MRNAKYPIYALNNTTQNGCSQTRDALSVTYSVTVKTGRCSFSTNNKHTCNLLSFYYTFMYLDLDYSRYHKKPI